MCYEFYGIRMVQLDTGDWDRCMGLAEEFGWHPAGTAPPDDWQGSWDGGYYSNDLQMVEESDARALGEALLHGIANEEVRERDKPTKWPDGSLRRLRGFAEFARGGRFQIG
jgi:hypothetical protein